MACTPGGAAEGGAEGDATAREFEFEEGAVWSSPPDAWEKGEVWSAQVRPLRSAYTARVKKNIPKSVSIL
jgi:hypothetical protein